MIYWSSARKFGKWFYMLKNLVECWKRGETAIMLTGKVEYLPKGISCQGGMDG